MPLYTLCGMIEIGKTKIIAVRVKGPNGKLTIKRTAEGSPETKVATSDVWRQTRDTLGGQYGRDKHRKLVVGLVAVDQLVLYPKGTRQEVRLNLKDIYAWGLRNRALRAQLERARERKEKLKVSRERRAIAAADRRIRLAAKSQRLAGAVVDIEHKHHS
jgi:hypothetical protein